MVMLAVKLSLPGGPGLTPLILHGLRLKAVASAPGGCKGSAYVIWDTWPGLPHSPDRVVSIAPSSAIATPRPRSEWNDTEAPKTAAAKAPRPCEPATRFPAAGKRCLAFKCYAILSASSSMSCLGAGRGGGGCACIVCACTRQTVC